VALGVLASKWCWHLSSRAYNGGILMKQLKVLNIDGSLFRENCGWCIKKKGGTTTFCHCLVEVLSRDMITCDKVENKK